MRLLFTAFLFLFLTGGTAFGQETMTREEMDVWISSGASSLNAIYAEFENVDWEKFADLDENAPRGADMVEILVVIIKNDEKTLALLNDKLKTADTAARRGILFTIQKSWKLKPELVDGLAVAARDSNRNVRFHAAILLSEIQSDKIVPALIQLVDSEKDEIVRCKLAEGLVKQKSRKGTDVLLRDLNDNDMWVREAAANGLSFSKEKDVYNALEKAIKTEQSNIVQSAIISSMNSISGISQQRLWDKYVLKKKEKAVLAPAAPKPQPKPVK